MSGYKRHIRREAWFSLVSLCLAGTTLLLFVVNLGLIYNARQRQEEINYRQAAINEGNAREQLSDQISKTLVDIAVRTNDDNIRTMLRAEGLPNWKDALQKRPAHEPDKNRNKESE